MKKLTKAQAQAIVRKIEMNNASLKIFCESLSPATLTAITKGFLSHHGARFEIQFNWNRTSEDNLWESEHTDENHSIQLMRTRGRAKWMDDI